ncbi:hypothetical protein [Rhodoferax sp.]|uniref:hypothetical protein n=1 Tax=Rhodoferax sp. TaxID=50421 RepID=UPI002852AFEF|nr:hypothetical protein [Rhodoferax sp.]
MQKLLAWIAPLATVVIALALAVLAFQTIRSHDTPELTTPYQAIALMNGQVFFGRAEGLERDYVVLHDVFYIQSRQNPDTKQVSNVLIKRGGEAHAPDRMIVNRLQLLLIEPVAENSQIAKLIAEQNKAH